MYNRKIIETKHYIEEYRYEKPIKNGFKKEIPLSKQKKKSDDLDRLKRLKKSRLEAKHSLMRLVDTNYKPGSKFLTLTTKENIQNRDDFNLKFDKFMKRLNYYCFKTKKKQLQYIGVYEKQKREAIHVHLILFNLPYIPHSDLVKLWGLGAVNIKRIDIDSEKNVARYIAKYMTKGIEQELLESLGKKSYIASRNLKKPRVLKLLSDSEQDDTFSDSEIVIESEYYSRIYADGEYTPNKVKYRKIKK